MDCREGRFLNTDRNDLKILPKIYNKNIIKVLTDNDLQCILNHVKVKSVIQLKPLAGRVPVKRKRFAGFIKCLINGFRNVPEAYFFEKPNSEKSPKKAK